LFPYFKFKIYYLSLRDRAQELKCKISAH